MNAILHLFRTSYPWRKIPQELFLWKNISYYLIRRKNEDFIESLVDKLRSNICVSSRQEPSDTEIIDFRNVRTSFHANANRNLNENKKSRKQHNVINNHREQGLSLFVQPRFMSTQELPKSLKISLANFRVSSISFRTVVIGRMLLIEALMG